MVGEMTGLGPEKGLDAGHGDTLNVASDDFRGIFDNRDAILTVSDAFYVANDDFRGIFDIRDIILTVSDAFYVASNDFREIFDTRDESGLGDAYVKRGRIRIRQKGTDQAFFI